LVFDSNDPQNPSIVFGQQFSESDIILKYDGVISRGMIITITSVGEVSNIELLAVKLETNKVLGKFTLLGTYPANTEIVIDSRDGFLKATANGIDITQNVAPGSTWLRLQPGTIAIFTSFIGIEQIDVVVEVKQDALFEVQS